MATSQIAPPPGFELDDQPAKPAPPSGFVLDSPKQATKPAPPQGFVLDSQTQPERTPQDLASDDRYNPEVEAAKYQPGHPEWEKAFQVDQARKNWSFGEKVAGVIPKIPGMIAEGVKGVGRFAVGLVAAPLHTAAQAALDVAAPALRTVGAENLAQKAENEQLTQGAEATLAGEQIEQGLRGTAHTLRQWTPYAEDARNDFKTRVQNTRNQMQLAQGKPIDTGAVGTVAKWAAGGNAPSEVYSPESLQEQGARPVSQFYVNAASASGDPMNLLFPIAAKVPFAGRIGGAITEGLGKAMQVPGKAMSATGGAILGRAGKLGQTIAGAGVGAGLAEAAPTIIAHPAVALAAGVAAGATKGLQWLGKGLEDSGASTRGVLSPLEARSATAGLVGSAGAPDLQRFVGDVGRAGITTAVGMAPINYALSGGDPERFSESEVGAGMFGGVFGAFESARPALAEAARPYLRSEGARHVADQMQAGDSWAKKSAAFINAMPEAAKNITLETIGTLGSMPTATEGGTRTSKLYVLNAADYQAALDANIPKDQQPGAGSRGYYDEKTGTAYINGESASHADPNELAHTIGHEFGGHAAMNILATMSGKNGPLSTELINAASKGLLNADGTPTRAFQNFIDGYNARFGYEKINAKDPASLHEFLSETAGQVWANSGAAEIALPKSLLDRITQNIGNFAARLTGADPQKIGGKTNFNREEIGSITQAVSDSLRQIAGAKLRGGAELPPEAQSAASRIAELHEILAKEKPQNPTAEQMKAYVAERAQARQELKAIGEQPDRVAKQQARAEQGEARAASRRLVDLYKFSRTDAGAKVNAALQAARAEGRPITADELINHARTGKFTEKPTPEQQAQPIQPTINATFNDPTGTHTITGAVDRPARANDFIQLRDGTFRRVVKPTPDGKGVETVASFATTDDRTTPVNHGDYVVLDTDYALKGEQTQGAAPNAGVRTTPAGGAPAPGLRVVPNPRAGGGFIVVDENGKQVNKGVLPDEAAANRAKGQIEREQKASIDLPINRTGAEDVIDAIKDRTGGIYFGNMTPEEREDFISIPGDAGGKIAAFIRSKIASNDPANTPDDIASRLAEQGMEEGTPEQPHGDGTSETLGQLIADAYTARTSMRDQLATEEQRQKEEQKNAPPAPSESQQVPPSAEPPVARAVAANETPEPSTLSEATIAAIANEAEIAVRQTRTNRHKESTLPKAITDAQIDAVTEAHAAATPLNYEGIRERTTPTGRKEITGRINPARPFDAFLLKLADLSDTAIANLRILQDKIGQTVSINYGHAPHEGGPVIAEARRTAQKEHTAAARAAGEAPTQAEDKNIIPLEVKFNKGKETPSITVLGASQEKLLNNFNLATAEVERLGGFVPYKPINEQGGIDPHFVMDAKHLTENHRNGFTFDGKRIKPVTGVEIPQPAEGFIPHVIPTDRFEFLNLILGDESAKTGKRTTPEMKLKQDLANANAIGMTGEGEVNGLREAINQNNKGITDADGNPTTWSKKNIENPLSEAIRVDLVNEVYPEVRNEDQSIRPHGYTGDIGRFFAEGSPSRLFSASGFMPEDTSAPKPPKWPDKDETTGKLNFDDVLNYGTQKRKWIEDFTAWAQTQPANKPIVLKDGDTRAAVIHPSASEQSKWRTTRFVKFSDEGWQPTGHLTFDSKAEAIKDALTKDGFKEHAPEINFLPETAGAENASEPKPEDQKTPQEKAKDRILSRQWTSFMPENDEKNLVAVHNLTIDNLRHVLKMGGLPVPSMAVIRTDRSTFNSFGDITLIAPKEFIDPKQNRDAKMFNADVYSPRYPTVETKWINKEQTFKKLADIASGAPDDWKRNVGSPWQDVEIRREGIADAFKKSDLLKLAWAMDTGKKLPEIPSANKGYEQGFMMSELRQLTDAHKEEFEKWADDFLKENPPQSKERIFQGFTNAGDRRYARHDLDTVVRILKRELQGGEGFNYGVPSIRAEAAKKFRSIEGMQKAREDVIPEADMQKLKDETNDEFLNLYEKYAPPQEGFGGLDSFSEDMKAINKGGAENWKWLRERYPNGVPQEMRDFLEKLKNMPTEYFEGKIQRAVALHEFSGAVIPDNTPADLKTELQKRGITISEYPKGDIEARKQAVATIANKTNAAFMPEDEIKRHADDAGAIYQGATNGLHAFKELSTGGNFSIRDKDLTPEAIKAKSEQVRKSFAGEETITPENLNDFLRSQGIEPKFMPEEERDPFYSQLTRTIQNLPQATMTAGQARAAIEKGSKADEQKMSGIFTDPLSPMFGKQPDDRVKKSDLTGYALERQAKVQDVVLSDLKRSKSDSAEVRTANREESEARYALQMRLQSAGLSEERADAIANKIRLEQEHGRVDERDRISDEHPDYAEAVNGYSSAIARRINTEAGDIQEMATGGGTHFSQYQLPGADEGSYREMFVTWPGGTAAKEKLPTGWKIESQMDGQVWNVYDAEGKYRTTGRTKNEAERQAAAVAREGDWQKTLGWRDGHSQYSDITNPIVRIRRNIRTEKTQEDKQALNDYVNSLKSKYGETGYTELMRKVTPEEQAQVTKLDDAARLGHKTFFIEEIQGPSKTEQEKMPPELKKRIYEIGMKRALRDAIDEGADKIAWTTGEQQAERYDLSKQVSRVVVQRQGIIKGQYELSAYDDRNNEIISKEELDAASLAEHIGKDLAQRAIEDIDVKRKPFANYRGDDLKVGGEGLKRLYDQTLPRIANELAKKFGVKVATQDIKTSDESPSVPSHDEDGNSTIHTTVHSLEILPAMRDALKQGQALFMPEDTQDARTFNDEPIKRITYRPPIGATGNDSKYYLEANGKRLFVDAADIPRFVGGQAARDIISGQGARDPQSEYTRLEANVPAAPQGQFMPETEQPKTTQERARERKEAMGGQSFMPEEKRTLRLYRGEYSGNQGGRFYHPEKEFARQFTQSGQDKEIRSISIKKSDIFRDNPLPYAGDTDQMDATISKAQKAGKKAIYADENGSESVLVFTQKKTHPDQFMPETPAPQRETKITAASVLGSIPNPYRKKNESVNRQIPAPTQP